MQILFWGVIWMLIPFLLTNSWESWDRFLMRGIVIGTGVGLLVFVNLEVMLPRFFFSKKFFWYVLSGLGLTILVLLVIYWDQAPWAAWLNLSDRPHTDHRPPNPIYEGFRWISRSVPFVTAFIGSSLFEIAAYAGSKEKETIQLQKEKLETELKFLKSQINPHFLFNTLNNIYTLTVLRAESAPEQLLRLSEILRYMLYDCTADRVPLKKEIDYIRNYISLKMLKDSKGMNVVADLDDSRPDLLIAPMLFIPFIENAFKHSHVEDLQKGWIRIRLKTGPNWVQFDVENSLQEGPYSKDRTGGIGLENVRRQLELIYPDQHTLVLGEQVDHFAVSLKIQLA
ncbi:MAG: histidine kinase [Lewinellaceae bacterium]|nr:histidine kinase [Lewinellaceae bacterium]